MTLKSKEVRAASAGGTSEFIQMLMDSTVTQNDIDEYAATPEGVADISSLTSISEQVLLMNDNINRIITSPPVRKSLFSNTVAGAGIIFIDGVIDTISATDEILAEFYASPVNLELLASGRAVHLLYDAKYMELSLVDTMAMRIIAGDPALLSMAFGTTANRRRMFDEGGSEIAFILLRESIFARQWILDNVSVTYRHVNNGRRTLNKRCYYLRQRCYSTHSSYNQYAGTFLGDHRTGEVNIGTNSSAWRDLNERCNPLTQRQTVSNSTWWTEATYVEME